MIVISSARALFESCLVDDAVALWYLEDAVFVQAALNSMVDCEMAQREAMRFVLLLRQGFSKHSVLLAMAVHWGKSFRPGRVPGVRRRLRYYRIGCWPVLGRLVRLVFDLPSESNSERRLRIIENQLYLLAKGMYESLGDAKLPLAPWGGLHRVRLLNELIDAESRMSPEVKAVYVALVQATARSQPDDLAL